MSAHNSPESDSRKDSRELQLSIMVLLVALSAVVCLTLFVLHNPPTPETASVHRSRGIAGDYATKMARGRKALHENGDLAAARKYFEEARRLDPNSSEAADALGKTILAAGQPEEALDLFELASRRRPMNPHFQADRAIALLCLDRLDEAEAAARRGQRLNKDADANEFVVIMACIAQKREDAAKANVLVRDAHNALGDQLVALVQEQSWAAPLRENEAFIKLAAQTTPPPPTPTSATPQ